MRFATPCCHAVFIFMCVNWNFHLALILPFNLRLAFLLHVREFRFTAGGHGSIHQSVANEAIDVWRGYAIWSTARTCYRRIQAWQESRSGTDVKRWRGTRVVWFLVSTLLGICLMCCLLSDWGRSGSTMFELIKVNVIQLNFRGRSLVWRLNLLHLADMFDVWFFDFLHFASCWTVDVWLIACPFLQLRLRAIGHRRPGATLSYQDVAWQLQFLPISVCVCVTIQNKPAVWAATPREAGWIKIPGVQHCPIQIQPIHTANLSLMINVHLYQFTNPSNLDIWDHAKPCNTDAIPMEYLWTYM